MAQRLLTDFADWSKTEAAFHWDIPEFFNIAEHCVTRWAKAAPDRLAILDIDANEGESRWTFGDLDAASNRFANVLRNVGVGAGDRVAIILPQSAEVMITHFAAYKLGAIVVPLFSLFGPDALQYRLSDSGAKVAVTNAETAGKLRSIRATLPDLDTVYCVDDAAETQGFWAALDQVSDLFDPVQTRADDPSCLIYTSGTTGSPKGALHAHRFLLGHLTGVEMYLDFFPQQGDIGWTPADWAWIGGLMDLAMPCLYYGMPLVSHSMRKFTPEAAYHLLAQTKANTLFLPPTALKLMRRAPVPEDVSIRVISSGGEALSDDLIQWVKEALKADVNEMYGQTECNLVLGSQRAAGISKPGRIGKAVPGHTVAIIGPDGQELPPGTLGEIAVRSPDPVMMLGYWNKPRQTAEKFNGDWLLTGDLGIADEDGFVRFSSRSDDLISSAGYRIGPSEIEDCLSSHPDVVMAAAIGVPDDIRGEVVKAFVVLKTGVVPDGLEETLINRVKSLISPHVAPKSIEFRDELPMTTTGKILRRALRAGDEQG